MSGTSLGPGAEFDAIRGLVERWGILASGIGDDAAVVSPARGDSIVLSVDAAVEGVHFDARWLSPAEIGYRATVAALSDLAAMAATPIGILVAFALPDSWRDRLAELADGIGDAVSLAGASILGGNLSDAEALSITTTVVGRAFAPLTRSGARDGDRIFVTGRFGGPLSALTRLQAGESAGSFRERFARPAPRLLEARWLADRGATAAVDISDGLVADLGHLAAASRVSLALDVARVPLVDGVTVETALRSGEEYELAVSAPASLDVAQFEREFGLPLTDIGAVAASASPGVLVRGVEVAALGGHDHFSN